MAHIPSSLPHNKPSHEHCRKLCRGEPFRRNSIWSNWYDRDCPLLDKPVRRRLLSHRMYGKYLLPRNINVKLYTSFHHKIIGNNSFVATYISKFFVELSIFTYFYFTWITNVLQMFTYYYKRIKTAISDNSYWNYYNKLVSRNINFNSVENWITSREVRKSLVAKRVRAGFKQNRASPSGS